MKQARILAVGMLPPPLGGQALMFERAIKALRTEFDLTVVDIQFQRNLGESGLFSLRKLAHFFVLLFGRIIPLALTKKFDALYYCLSGPGTLGLFKDLCFLSILRLRARKTVYHLHGAGGITFLLKGNIVLRGWTRLVLFEPDLVLRPNAPSTEGALCNAKRDLVIDNCVEDPQEMLSGTEAKWPARDLAFAFVGVLTEDKGVFELVEIARQLRDKGFHFTMYLVGQGTTAEVKRLSEMISRYRLTDSIRLTGVLFGDEKFGLLRKTTIFLFPTFFRAETQPTAIMEAFAVGVPAVAYDWRGVSSIIEPGVNGYLVPPHDVDTFCRAIEKILTDGNIDRMRADARRTFLDRFTLDRHIAALLDAFHSLGIEA